MKLADIEFIKLLPQFMRDDDAVRGLAAAVDKIVPDLAAEIEKLSTWNRIDDLSEAELIELHMGKTGAMICASAQLGCLAAGFAPNHEMTEKLTSFAQKIGLVFQIIDDILDVTSTNEELGKNIGSDSESNKTTFLSFFTVEQAYEYAKRLTQDAIDSLDNIEGAEGLINLAQFLCDRKK